MPPLLGFDQLPAPVAEQLHRVVELWKKQLPGELVGIYLHGSIALRAFRPESGDLDVLAVVKNSLSTKRRLALAAEMIKLDGQPCPLELSAVRLCDLHPWKTPGNCVFHYSDYWRERYQKRLSDPAAECYVVDQDFPDADVTSYIRLIRQCGIVLYGPPFSEVFEEISDEDFWATISADVDEYDFHSYAPRYLASNILILGRILSFKETHTILSKYDAGLWMTEHVPQELKYLPLRAMKVWYEGETQTFPEDDLERLRQYLIGKIKG